MSGIEAVLHAATLHEPHVATHEAQAFIDTNVTGTRVLLESALALAVRLPARAGQPARWA
jgi:UDP-glucose 4-epimerase